MIKGKETKKLDELCDVTSSKRIYASEYKDEGVPFYRGKEIIEKQKGNLEVSTEIFISEERYEEIKEKYDVPKSGDLLLTSVGTLGVPYVIDDGEKFYFKDGNLIWFKNFDGLNSEYLYYWFLSPQGEAQLKRSTIGSSQSAFTITLLKDVEIALPPLDIQQQIASILSAFDDLIENNTRRIEILEEMARRIYREWFVHFRYPGHENDGLVDSDTELGEIPEGWDIVEVQDVINVNPRTSIDKEKERPYLPMADVSENSMLINDTDLEYRDGSGGSKFKNYDTLFARITPSLENGKTGFVQFLKSDEQIALGSTEFIVLRSKKLNPYFVYCLARDEQFRETAIKSMAGASGRQRVRIGTIKEFKVTFPPKKLLDKFRDAAETMFKEIGVLSEQNKRLKETRDLLLPKLISGKIDVEELNINERKISESVL